MVWCWWWWWCCLLACLLPCLLACSLACFLACLLALLACSLAFLLACLLAPLLACLLWLACLLACWLGLAWLGLAWLACLLIAHPNPKNGKIPRKNGKNSPKNMSPQTKAAGMHQVSTSHDESPLRRSYFSEKNLLTKNRLCKSSQLHSLHIWDPDRISSEEMSARCRPGTSNRCEKKQTHLSSQEILNCFTTPRKNN